MSRTGVIVHHSPRFRTTLDPGTFRVETYERPVSTALLMDDRGSGEGFGSSSVSGSGSGSGRGMGPGVNAGLTPSSDAALSMAAKSKDPQNAPGSVHREREANERDASELRGLVSRFVAEQRGARALGVRPVSITFPQMGPMLYLAAELTAEGSAPAISLRYKREGN